MKHLQWKLSDSVFGKYRCNERNEELWKHTRRNFEKTERKRPGKRVRTNKSIVWCRWMLLFFFSNQLQGIHIDGIKKEIERKERELSTL